MARLKDRLMDARLARSLAILIIVTLALYALTAVAFHHLFATQIGEVRNLAYSLEGQYIGSWQTFRPTPIQPGVKVAAAAMLRRDRTQDNCCMVCGHAFTRKCPSCEADCPRRPSTVRNAERNWMSRIWGGVPPPLLLFNLWRCRRASQCHRSPVWLQWSRIATWCRSRS